MEEKEKLEKEEKQEKQTEKINDKVTEQVEEKIKKIIEVGVQSDNVDYLYKLVDIHKDLANEDYWKCKKEVLKMRYYGEDEYGAEEYGNYGRRMRDGRGRYMARGYDAKYRGEDMINDMRDMYGNYSESKEEYGRGNYRAKEDTMKSLDYMLQSVMEFMKKLEKEADSPEEVELVKKYARKIGMM